MLKIGFANKFYTLWDTQTEYQYKQDSFGHYWTTGIKVNNYYIKNISIDLEKVKAQYPDVEIDEELRGRTSSWGYFLPKTMSDVKWMSQEEIEVFQFGRDKGNRIEDVANEGRESCEYIDWYLDFRRDQTNHWGVDQVREYAMSIPAYKDHYENKHKRDEMLNKAKGFNYTDGDKVELKIKEIISEGGFQTDFGYMTVQVMLTSDNKIVKYKGGSPKDLPEPPFKLQATIKHSSYESRGEKIEETKLLRIKMI